MTQQDRISLAQQALAIMKNGSYMNRAGERVEIAGMLAASVDGTRLIRPNEWPAVVATGMARATGSGARVEVTGETTLAALYRLIAVEGRADVAALNFASARNPGGGFLNGARAQEETLARSSGLYETLLVGEEYYRANRVHNGTLYTDHAILSPGVPVFREDGGELLDRPYLATFLTMPAPNLGAMRPESEQLSQVPATFERRIEYVFALAAASGVRHLVLGAWGCGAFRNDATVVAELYARELSRPDSWRNRFESIFFAIFDPQSEAPNRRAFERAILAGDASA